MRCPGEPSVLALPPRNEPGSQWKRGNSQNHNSLTMEVSTVSGEIFSSPKVDGVEVCRKNCLSKFCGGVYDPSWKSVQSIRWQSSIGPNGSNRIYPAFSALAVFFYQYSSIFWQWKCFPSWSSSSFYPTCSLSPLSFGLCSAAFIDAFSKVVKCQKFQK